MAIPPKRRGEHHSESAKPAVPTTSRPVTPSAAHAADRSNHRRRRRNRLRHRALAHDAWVVTLDRRGLENSSASMTLEVDVTDREAVTEAMARVAEERGGLDWVVCSAGIVKDRDLENVVYRMG